MGLADFWCGFVWSVYYTNSCAEVSKMLGDRSSHNLFWLVMRNGTSLANGLLAVRRLESEPSMVVHTVPL